MVSETYKEKERLFYTYYWVLTQYKPIHHKENSIIQTLSTWNIKSSSHTFSKHLSSVSTKTCKRNTLLKYNRWLVIAINVNDKTNLVSDNEKLHILFLSTWWYRFSNQWSKSNTIPSWTELTLPLQMYTTLIKQYTILLVYICMCIYLN